VAGEIKPVLVLYPLRVISGKRVCQEKGPDSGTESQMKSRKRNHMCGEKVIKKKKKVEKWNLQSHSCHERGMA